jgi:hypothetical protein
MAQETPSNLLYAQALQEINRLRQEYSVKKNKSPQEIAEIVNAAIGRFVDHAGKSLITFEPIHRSEVPTSEKMNRFWNSLQSDINILQDQVDLLNASTIFEHNFIKTEIMKSAKDNLRLQNKIKTLELYSNVSDDSLVFFGDTFITEDFIDWNFISTTERASLIASGHVTLKIKEQTSAVSAVTQVKVLPDSNGFFGNNQEVKDPAIALSDPVSNQKLYQFISQTNKHANIKTVLDEKPSTWFEFEKYLVSPTDRAKAKGYNFEYALSRHELTNHLQQADSSIGQSQTRAISWADGVANGVLKLYFEIDLGVDKQVNAISLLPYGLEDNKNNPIRIVRVLTSLNKTDWTALGPENVWIANSIDKKISSVNAENIVIGSAAWVTIGEVIRYIRFEIEQPKPIDCNIGHLYYVSKTSPAVNTPNYTIELPTLDVGDVEYGSSIPYNAPIPYGGAPVEPVLQDSGYTDYIVTNTASQSLTIPQTPVLQDISYRELGPLPPAENPQYYFEARNSTVNDLIQKKEVFKGKRWAIGIRDISIVTNKYDTKGFLVSKKFDIPGIVDRVALEADVSIPNDWDSSVNWIKFYISPDNGSTWYQISRIQDDFLNIPEIIAFNDPTPQDLREPGVGYYNVKNTVKSIRLKVEITRPDTAQNSTPVLKSYKLKVIQRK